MFGYTIGRCHACGGGIRLTVAAPWCDDFCDRVVDDVQQRLHDDFIDTAWPRCPLHPNHPLWLVDGSWSCTEAGRSFAPLGQLPRRA